MTKTLALILALILAVLLAVPTFAQSARVYPGCTLVTGHIGSDAIVTRSRTYYACTTATGERVPVSKAWFKAHRTRTYDGGADVDAFAVPAKAGETLAGGPGFFHKLGMGTLYVVMGAAIILIVANGGGGAFQ